jgi:predicted flap endonuclease-1-like 5' DNA nuclease
MDQNGTELVWQEDVTGKIRVAAELDHRANRIGSESSDAETESYRANILKATRNSSRSNKKRNYQPLSQSGTPKDTAREFDSENENIMHQASDSGRNERSNEMSREPSPVRSRRSSAVTQTSRFYLELNDNVEAAPTIGPKTAEHLEEIGIITVSELVETDPGWIANELSNKRIKEANVEQWQYQAMLVCQVPNLRGHDSQILVACGILDAEQLADMDPAVLFGIVGPFSKTKEGQKWLRGAKVPDLAEVTDWVSWAQEMRPLDQAA